MNSGLLGSNHEDWWKGRTRMAIARRLQVTTSWTGAGDGKWDGQLRRWKEDGLVIRYVSILAIDDGSNNEEDHGELPATFPMTCNGSRTGMRWPWRSR